MMMMMMMMMMISTDLCWLCRQVRNDGIDNLLGAFTIAGHYEIPEVLLYFRSKAMRGNRTWKVLKLQ
jgi:L-asparaginase/Glu-tRNA(Gln) amidotransferase subunit D